MAKSLKNMLKEKVKDPNLRPAVSESVAPAAKETDVSELMNRYSGKNENELMSELIAAVSEQKKEGIFDFAQAEAMAQAIMPMLNAEQTEKLNGILEMLR